MSNQFLEVPQTSVEFFGDPWIRVTIIVLDPRIQHNDGDLDRQMVWVKIPGSGGPIRGSGTKV